MRERFVASCSADKSSNLILYRCHMTHGPGYPAPVNITRRTKSNTLHNMSDAMIPGAYLIRNKKNRKVLHCVGVCFEDMSLVYTFNQEDRYRHRQIWWIEPLPSYADKTDPVYSITIPASGRALDMDSGEGIASE